MTWSLAFEPLAAGYGWSSPSASLVAVAARRLRRCFRRMRGAWLRAAAVAVAGPRAPQPGRAPRGARAAADRRRAGRRRERQPDARRPRQDDRRRRAPRSRSASPSSGTSRSATSTPARPAAWSTARMLFGPLGAGLADVPPERIGAVVMLTDGQVHDAPGDGAGARPFGAPLHVLLSGHDGERDRRIVIDARRASASSARTRPSAIRVLDDGAAETGAPRPRHRHPRRQPAVERDW